MTKGQGVYFFFRQRRLKKKVLQFAWTKNYARQKTRVALHATSLAVAVAQNGYCDPNYVLGQQRNSYFMPW